MSDSHSKGRTLVNALGIPGLLLIIWLGGLFFTAFMTLVIFMSLREFYAMYHSKGVYPSMSMGAVSSIFLIWYYHNGPYLNMLTFLQLFFAFITFLLLFEMFSKKVNPASNVSYTLFGIGYIPVLLGSLIALRQIDSSYDTYYTLSVFLGVWICDSAAFGFGMKWGKKKILPRISPKKSIVGSVAGFISSLIFFLSLSYFNYPSADFTLQDVIIFSIITGIFGQLGDFVESMFKRDIGVKDSGTFLLGHGGVLDRFDSLILAAPLTYFYLLF